MIGRTLAHYEIVEKIGAGGMGEVYRATDTRLGRDVALKILPAAAASDPERRQRFEREARAIAALHHPNIVTIHSVEEADGIAFLTMELVRGKTLGDLIPADGLPLARLFEIGIPLADAVQAAHERGVIHRDLKPGNVMIDDAGHLKVLDFGLAKLIPGAGDDERTVAAGDSTQQGRILGTVAYMSPEQAEGRELDARSDIFSLGVVLYQMATGQRPFAGDTPISTMSAILRDDPPSVTSLRPLPRHLGRVIHRCLQKRPDKRFQTARDVSNELEGLKREVESGEVEAVSGIMTAEMAAAAAPRGRKGVWIGIAAVALVAAASGIWMFARREAPEPEGPPDLKIAKLTSAVGVEYVGSWAPDGHFFAFSHSANGPLDIFIQATAGGDPVRLVESPYDDYPAAWSPDNRWIAFGSGRDGKSAVYLIPPLGGTIRHLADLGFPPLYINDNLTLSPTPWSPDGALLVFSRSGAAGAALWIVEVATGRETRLTDGTAIDGAAAWSFDGRSIAFYRMTDGKRGIWVIPAGGGEARRVHEDVESEWMSLGWSPDDRSLVFGSRREGSSGDLWSLDIASGAVRRLTSGVAELNGACVGRDGRLLANDFTHQTDLYLQQLDGGEARRLTFHTQSNFEAQVSPDGGRIAYMSDRTGNAEIWILDLETGREIQATDHEAIDRSPAWAPDGETLVFASTRSGEPGLWAVDRDGGGARPFLEGRTAMAVRWSPDGEALGFLSYGESGATLWVAGPDGGSPHLAMENVGEFGWYVDGRRLIYTPFADGPPQIRARDLDSGADVLLLEEPHIELAVAPDGSALTYCSARSHFNMNLHLLRLEEGPDGLPRASGDPVKLTAGDGEWHVHNGGFTPDGRSVVYTRDTDTANIYLIEGAFPGDGTAR